jgi:hypothetical protein
MLMVPPRVGGGAGRALGSFCHIDGRPAKSARSLERILDPGCPAGVHGESYTVSAPFGVSFFS